MKAGVRGQSRGCITNETDEAVCRKFFVAAAAALGVNMAFRVNEAIGPRPADALRAAAISLLDVSRLLLDAYIPSLPKIELNKRAAMAGRDS